MSDPQNPNPQNTKDRKEGAEGCCTAAQNRKTQWKGGRPCSGEGLWCSCPFARLRCASSPGAGAAQTPGHLTISLRQLQVRWDERAGCALVQDFVRAERPMCGMGTGAKLSMYHCVD